MKLLRNLPTRISKSGRLESWAIFWCDYCKSEVEKRLSQGRRDKSCGSLGCKKNKKAFKHGEGKTRLHSIWTNMKTRILNSNATGYKNWGGRGITICPEWAESYIVFRDWALNNGYAEGLQINRKNTDGNYEPSNCNFVTAKENLRNTTRNVIKSIEEANEIRELYNTGNYTQRELAKMFNVSETTISLIINNKQWKNE